MEKIEQLKKDLFELKTKLESIDRTLINQYDNDMIKLDKMILNKSIFQKFNIDRSNKYKIFENLTLSYVKDTPCTPFTKWEKIDQKIEQRYDSNVILFERSFIILNNDNIFKLFNSTNLIKKEVDEKKQEILKLECDVTFIQKKLEKAIKCYVEYISYDSEEE